jgi:hypothetical protein
VTAPVTPGVDTAADTAADAALNRLDEVLASLGPVVLR